MKKLFVLCALGIAAVVPAGADACTIPVFRYALEKWDLTRYRFFVFQRGALPAELDKSLKALGDNPNRANIDITVVDLEGDVEPKLLKLWQHQEQDGKRPWLVVRYKDVSAGEFTHRCARNGGKLLAAPATHEAATIPSNTRSNAALIIVMRHP